MDHVKIVDTWPAQDTLASILRQSSSNGGSPYNILVDLAHLGAPFPLAAVGLVGDDENGRAILADCRAHGIDTRQLHTTAAAATSYTDVMTVESTGRRTFFHQRGANAHLDIEHFNFKTTTAKLFHLGYLLLLDRLDLLVDGRPRAGEVLQRARAAGLYTSIDCVSEDSQRFHTVIAPVLPWVDLFFANDFEAEKITGIPLRRGNAIHSASVIQAARKLLEAGVQSWVVIHFPEAVYACDRRGNDLWQPSLQVPPTQIAGAAGAGDALAAGVLLGMHEDWPMAECLKLGVTAAAASLAHPSCSATVPRVEECRALAARLGYRPLPT
ncbi:MAG: carbohydrate kinase family protein [Opitutaceae bacterium]|nr:carbohydrate kinase family protein [Opitutaceae bacterium]